VEKRLSSQALGFALVEREAGSQKSGPTEASDRRVRACLELVLTSGERQRIGRGVDGATLQTVLETFLRMIQLPAAGPINHSPPPHYRTALLLPDPMDRGTDIRPTAP
jgi:hypothetical protein